MNPAERDFLLYLEDMVVSIHKIIEALKNVSDFEELEKDWIRYDAVLRNLEVIGEATRKIPESVKANYKHVPWDDMYRTRNILIHHYFGVDAQIIWRIAKIHLPINLPDIEAIINDFS